MKKQLIPVCYKLHIPASPQIPNSFHISLLKPLGLNNFSKNPSSASKPKANAVFEVMDILDVKKL